MEIEKKPWHMDKGVSLGTVIAIAVQTLVLTIGIVTWGTTVDARLLSLESQKATDARLSIIEANTAAIKEDRMLITADIKEIKTDIKLIAVQIGELNGTHNKTK
jgi:hypothetical protein